MSRLGRSSRVLLGAVLAIGGVAVAGVPAASATSAQPAAVPSAPAPTGGVLAAGQQVTTNQQLRSRDGRYYLVVQSDGNVVLYTAARTPVWSSATNGKGGVRLTQQTDGNLVLYTAGNRGVWATGTSGNSGGRTVVQDDGNVVVYRASGAGIWASKQHPATPPPPPPAPAPSDTLRSGQRLTTNQQLRSTSGAYRLAVQSDGNVVIYPRTGRGIWATGTASRGGRTLTMQTHGNLVLTTAAARPVWGSGSHSSGARAVLQNDGNFVIYRTNNTAVWTSKGGLVKAPPSKPANPGDAKNCTTADFPTWRQAQDWFNYYYPYYGDVARLDQDNDRIACEALPGHP